MNTVEGRVLLGWMPKPFAINFLLNDCCFDDPLNEVSAEKLWATYRDRVAALQPRHYQRCPRLGLDPIEAGHSQKFARFLNGQAHDVIDVAKLDARDFVVVQHSVVVDRAKDYAKKCNDRTGWLDSTLPTRSHDAQIDIRVTQAGLNTYTEIDVPHSEFTFIPDQSGKFGASQFLRHVTVMETAERTFLTAGYHRTFARVLSAPTATVPAAVVAVARNTLTSPTAPSAEPNEITGAALDPYSPFGEKAAVFGDFFKDGFFINVRLKKKRYQLQVNATMVALDETA